MKKIITIIAITFFGTGTVAGAIFFRQNMDKDTVIDTQKARISALTEKVSRLSGDYASLRKEMAETAAKVNALNDTNEQFTGPESILHEKEQAVKEARRQVNRCNELNESLSADLVAEKKSTASLNELLANSQGRIETLKSQIEKNRAEDAALMSDLKARYENRIKAARTEVAALEDDLSKKHRTLEEIRNHRDRCVESAEVLEKAFNDGRETVRGLENRLNQAQDRISDEREKVRTLSARIAASETNASILEKRIEEKTIQFATLEKQLSGMASEKGSVESRLEALKSAYDGLVKELNENIRNKEATIAECKEKLAVSFIDRILFQSAMITLAPEGREALNKVGKILKTLHYGKIRIVGHTDNKPIRSRFRDRFPTNWELSSARAAAVARFFEKENGIDPDRMEVVGYSYHQPITNNDTKEGRAKNRRVEIIVVPTLISG